MKSTLFWGSPPANDYQKGVPFFSLCHLLLPFPPLLLYLLFFLLSSSSFWPLKFFKIKIFQKEIKVKQWLWVLSFPFHEIALYFLSAVLNLVLQSGTDHLFNTQCCILCWGRHAGNAESWFCGHVAHSLARSSYIYCEHMKWCAVGLIPYFHFSLICWVVVENVVFF